MPNSTASGGEVVYLYFVDEDEKDVVVGVTGGRGSEFGGCA